MGGATDYNGTDKQMTRLFGKVHQREQGRAAPSRPPSSASSSTGSIASSFHSPWRGKPRSNDGRFGTRQAMEAEGQTASDADYPPPHDAPAEQPAPDGASTGHSAEDA
eukprot:10612182-Heterocapsa_arctica.AAC.1